MQTLLYLHSLSLIRQSGRREVHVSVKAHFVARSNNRRDRLRPSFCRQPRDEEGGRYLLPFEHLQNARHSDPWPVLMMRHGCQVISVLFAFGKEVSLCIYVETDNHAGGSFSLPIPCPDSLPFQVRVQLHANALHNLYLLPFTGHFRLARQVVVSRHRMCLYSVSYTHLTLPTIYSV